MTRLVTALWSNYCHWISPRGHVARQSSGLISPFADCGETQAIGKTILPLTPTPKKWTPFAASSRKLFSAEINRLGTSRSGGPGSLCSAGSRTQEKDGGDRLGR